MEQRQDRMLHLPKSHGPPIGKADPTLKRANRLALAAQAVGDLDVKAIAAAYQNETGGSGLEAATAAAAAMNAALRSSLLGEEGAAAAEREVRELAKKKARESRIEAFRAQQAAEEGFEGDLKRDEIRDSLEARASRAADCKASRLQDDAATRRAEREERLTAAASRRNLSEARAWLTAGQRRPRGGGGSPGEEGLSPAGAAPAVDDPVLRRARALCSGAAQVVAELDQQNELLRRKATMPRSGSCSAMMAGAPTQAAPAPARPGPHVGNHAGRFGAIHAAATSAEEQALLAKAQELLADYKPSESDRRRDRIAARQSSAHSTPRTSPKAMLSPGAAASRNKPLGATAVMVECGRGPRRR